MSSPQDWGYLLFGEHADEVFPDGYTVTEVDGGVRINGNGSEPPIYPRYQISAGSAQLAVTEDDDAAGGGLV